MAVDLRLVRDRVRMRMGGGDARRPLYVTPQIDQAMASAYIFLQSRLPAADLYTSSAVTISAGGDTFSLPTSVSQWTGNDGAAEYAGQVALRLVSTGQFLRKRTAEELDAFRNGSPTVLLSIPDLFTLWEDKGQIIQGRCYPGAKVSEACDLFVRLSANDPRDYVGAGTEDMDDVEIEGSRIVSEAVERQTASDLINRLPARIAEEHGIDKGVTKDWMREVEILLYQEAMRRHNMVGVGRTQRWVS